jgi:hypothetical protein
MVTFNLQPLLDGLWAGIKFMLSTPSIDVGLLIVVAVVAVFRYAIRETF